MNKINADRQVRLVWFPLATSAPGLGSPLPHLRRGWARPSHICTGAGLAPCRWSRWCCGGTQRCAARCDGADARWTDRLTGQAELESFKQLVAAKVPAAVCFLMLCFC
jgi:hypothetical protein